MNLGTSHHQAVLCMFSQLTNLFDQPRFSFVSAEMGACHGFVTSQGRTIQDNFLYFYGNHHTLIVHSYAQKQLRSVIKKYFFFHFLPSTFQRCSKTVLVFVMTYHVPYIMQNIPMGQMPKFQSSTTCFQKVMCKNVIF